MSLQFEDKTDVLSTYTEDEHPLNIFLKSDEDGREDILLSHPDVIGFLYVHENTVSKDFLQKKVVNFKATSPENKKIVAAVTGDAEDYTPFSVPISDIFKDILFLTDCSSLNKNTPSISIGKYIKDNEKDLPEIPNQFKSEAKMKKLKAAACPYILPIVRGLLLPEGDINENDIYKEISDAHDIYADWIFLHSDRNIITSHFNVNGLTCPIPEKAVNNWGTSEELPIKILFKNKNDSSSPFRIIKNLVEEFLSKHKKEMVNTNVLVPQEVNIDEDKTIVSSSTDSTKSNAINDRLATFFSILFASASDDQQGEFQLSPAIISDEVQEIMTSSSSTSDQARLIGQGIEVLADDISKEKNYLSRFGNFPFLTSTVLTYILQAHFHSGAIDESIDSLKKSFNILALLAPPQANAEEYTSFVNSSKNIDADRLLDQPSEKRSAVKKDIFIKGKQENLEDVIAFISNIVTFSRFWIKDQPYVIDLLTEIADYLSSAEYKIFDNKFNGTRKYMAHTLIAYIFNIFSIFVKTAKNPKIGRKFQIENTIDKNQVKLASIMHNNLIEQLQLCVATSSLQNLFAHPPTSFRLFCPALNATNTKQESANIGYIDKKRTLSTNNENEPNKKRLFGSIINDTGRRIMFPRGVEKKYCSDFMDTGKSCQHGDSCNFVHAVFPNGFSDNDKTLITKYVNETEGLSFTKNVSGK